MGFCVFDDDTVCKNKNFENNYEHRCIEADNLLKNEQTLCRYRIVKSNNAMSNEVCLYLFNGKCAHGLCDAHNKSCVRNNGKSCGFFMSRDTFKKHEEQSPFSKCRNKNQDNEKCMQCDESPLRRCYEPEIEGKPDNVIHPSHYCQGGIECIKAIEASMTPEEFQGYCKGNVIKYCWRFREKNGLEDLKKAQVYLGWMIESKEKQEKTK